MGFELESCTCRHKNTSGEGSNSKPPHLNLILQIETGALSLISAALKIEYAVELFPGRCNLKI